MGLLTEPGVNTPGIDGAAAQAACEDCGKLPQHEEEVVSILSRDGTQRVIRCHRLVVTCRCGVRAVVHEYERLFLGVLKVFH